MLNLTLTTLDYRICGMTGTNFGSLITALYGLGLFLGTIYSVPPLHLKRCAGSLQVAACEELCPR